MTTPHRIFVQIPSYRDPQLVPTLIDLVLQARAPSDLRVVVCWQHSAEETADEFIASGFEFSCTRSFDSRAVHFMEFRGVKIELVDVPYLEAKGAGWARSVAQQRFAGERYSLQIDAHHRFIKGWDVQMVAMLESLRETSAKPLLTGYPPAFSPASYPDGRQEQASAMLVDTFAPMGIVSFRALMLPEGRFNAPLRARFMSGGFVFSDGRFVEEVRQDPNQFFFTEEIVMAARAHTHGYDFFHPHLPLLWHDYASSAPEVWEDLTEEAKLKELIPESADDLAFASVGRALSLLGIQPNDNPSDSTCYGLGGLRSLHHYERFAGLSFSHRGVHRSATDLGEPEPEHTHLSDEQWESGLICKRTMQISVNLTAASDFEVYSVEVAMRDRSGRESPIKSLSLEEICTLVEHSALEFAHRFSSSPAGLPTTLLLQSETSHADAERFFSISAWELHA